MMKWLLEFLFGPEPQPQPEERVNTAKLTPIPDRCPMCGSITKHMRLNKNHGYPYIEWGCGIFDSTGCGHKIKCKPLSYENGDETR